MRHRSAQVGGVLPASRPAGRGPVGAVTRGTTGVGRLRKTDRWMRHRPSVVRALRAAAAPVAVDLGYGDGPTTTADWARALRTIRPDVQVVGLEIDAARVLEPSGGVEFALGGFELAGLRPHVVRAANVLRQYSEDEVAGIWAFVVDHMAPGGVLVEGTCDELGRRAAWVEVDGDGPRTLTLAWSPGAVDRPSDVAERLPKALIHRNVPGERVHELLGAADRAWDAAAGSAPFGPRQRWRAARALLVEQGVPLERGRAAGDRTRDNLLTVPWSAVAPG